MRIRPVPQRDDDVALAALRTRRRDGRHLAAGNTVRPVRVHRKHALAAHLRHAVAHRGARLARLDALVPRGDGVVEHAEGLRDLACGFIAKLMASRAPVGVDDAANELALAPHRRRDPVALRAGAGELTFWRDLQESEPVLRRVVLCGRFRIRCGHRLEVHCLSRSRPRLRRINKAVAAHPDVVVRFGQVGDEIAPLIVRDDDLDRLGRQVARFRNDPDAGLRAARSGDDAADVVVVDGHRGAVGLTGAGPDERRHHQEGNCERSDCSVEESDHPKPPPIWTGQ